MTKTKFLGLAMALCFGAAFSTASIAGDFTADFHLAHGQKCETPQDRPEGGRQGEKAGLPGLPQL